MDSLIGAAALALAAGDPLGALKRVALREDPPALALRGIAMAQLGEHGRARELLRRAARGFGSGHESLARARCIVAEAEIALATRDLGAAPRTLAAAVHTLRSHGDHANALHARLVELRRLLLIGRLAEAAALLASLDLAAAPPALAAVGALAEAELALRSLDTGRALTALSRAHAAALRSGVPALQAEVEEARTTLERPAARCRGQALQLPEIEALLSSGVLVVDACRRGIGCGSQWVSLARRPLLFALARALAQAGPGDAEREALIAEVFRTRHPDETHRARLRVEIGRLRALVRGMATIDATPRGFALKPLAPAQDLALLEPPIDGAQAALQALLADGAAWSTSALALALGDSQRTVQRALADLQAEGRVRAIGRARAQRWLSTPLIGFTTILLLPAALPSD